METEKIRRAGSTLSREIRGGGTVVGVPAIENFTSTRTARRIARS